MWTKNPRNLLDVEKSWINRLNDRWSDEYLSAIQVVIFIVDNAHTIRNAALLKGGVKPISSELAADGDGSPVEVTLYEAETGDFGELEFNRLDTGPLIEIPKLII
ncbi:hypothetical protein [Mesorhizobium sp. dw_380]|uniref:hypothetical protein n=1 Tax=Mesorhizobium sp. dw_380 TaxID=2812001 RepID=UPI001BDF06E6|nr:hypothetical protein [Mesorhizobium sp. dw_380]